jgi:hypothetical protein
MDEKPTTKIFPISTIVDGHVVDARVSFSPAPEEGVLSEVARFEAERLVAYLVREEIVAGSL